MRTALPLVLLAVLAACGGKIDGSSEPSGAGTVPGPTATPPSGGGISTPPSPPQPTPYPDETSYSATAWSGGLDHLVIFKTDFARDTCTRIHLSSPEVSTGPFSSIFVPLGWAVSGADRNKGAAKCGADTFGRAVDASSAGKGRIEWVPVPNHPMPCTLDVSAALLFDDGKAEQLDAKNVFVKNCS